ncbi:hypothetical protein PP178_03575 [Zeaxanthinibacter sp. PT1]|uniref:hypothetical protein n=1 Tax=Zeaxanthinibacter TaxID=561554 RepID=UPI00234A57C1|nr:hypothetical protein [Zeaxanthinibacter sp. PT1]MDC6350620.1 hypothetical protein [Zeaxanthinibacter sp. PT1]
MEQNTSNNRQEGSDEIDLGQLFKLINQGLTSIFIGILRIFLFLKRNIIPLTVLVVIGLLVGYGLNQVVTKKLKTEVIVKPYIESKNYLYDVIDEIQANIKAEDESFFKPIGIDVADLEYFEITIEPMGTQEVAENLEDEVLYLELLEKFQNTDLVSDVLLSEIYNKSTLNHKITYFYKNRETGHEIAKKLTAYINSNSYFKEVVETNRANAQARIENNENLVKQIDEMIASYSERMMKPDNENQSGRFVVSEDQPFDVTGLLNLKNGLMRDIERKRLELQQQKEPINILNFGMPQQVQKAFFGKNIVVIPLILVSGFFLFAFLQYLNRKSKEML